MLFQEFTYFDKEVCIKILLNISISKTKTKTKNQYQRPKSHKLSKIANVKFRVRNITTKNFIFTESRVVYPKVKVFRSLSSHIHSVLTASPPPHRPLAHLK